jgi:hypothetical protein
VTDSLSQAAEDLYALPPAAFTAARDELARQARSAGQRDDAALIKKLTRPTVSAWLVNQLVRSVPEPMSALYELGAALLAAQQELAGDRLRELSVQRRHVIAELMPEASRLAASAGVPVSGSALDEVRATLEAALADPGARDAVQSGQLTRALSYAGLGEVDLSAALAVTPASRPGAARSAGGQRPAASQRPAGGRTRSADAGGAEQAQRDLAEAEAEVTAAAQRLADADGEVAAVSEQRQFLSRRMDQLRAELADAEAEGRQLAKAARDAQRVHDAAARAVERAERQLTQARQRAKSR